MKVGLMVTCLADAMRPSVGFAALDLLEAAGCTVVVPETQTCCGQPAFNNGEKRLARDLAIKALNEFDDCDYVVLPSGSCAGMVRAHYPELFPDDPALLTRVKAMAEKTYELTDFLCRVIGLDKIPVTARFDGSVTYHDSCSGLRELGVKQQPRDLLAKVDGLHLKEMDEAETCCGFGGTFSVKFGDISAHMAENKCANATATGADAIVGGDIGCLMNIEGRLRRRGDHKTRVLHVAEVLTGRRPEEER